MAGARPADRGVFGYPCGLVGWGLLVLPEVLPARVSQVNGAKLWLRLGPVSIQPGEFAKILIIVFVAGFLVTNRELFTVAGRHLLGMTSPRPRDLAPLLTAWGSWLAYWPWKKNPARHC
jgi:cell division protein FtsW (lipid II flippase)